MDRPLRTAEEPRPLDHAEEAVLRTVLGFADFDGRDALLAQVDDARVVGRCGCGCATVDLAVEEEGATDAPALPIPNEAYVVGEDGTPLGGVLVFAREGKLASLEVYSNSDEPINPLPPVSGLIFDREARGRKS